MATERADYFDRRLRGRSQLCWLYRRYYLYPWLCRHLRGRVLDVGCGVGDMLACRANTVGVDINPRAVAWCRRRGLDARPMEPDRLPFADGDFDGVVLDNVLEHLARPQALLAEIRRVLPVGGRFVVGVPGRRGYASDDDHKVFYSEPALRETVQAAGFSDGKVLHAPVRSAWLDRHMRQYCLYGVFERR